MVTQPSTNQHQRGASRFFHFATLHAANTAAIHLLEAVKYHAPPDSYSSRCLISTKESIGYLLELGPPLVDNALKFWKRPGQWWIGSGRRPTRSRPSDLGVDFLLSPLFGHSHRRAQNSIDPVHATIQFHPESGALMLHSMSDIPVIYRDGLGAGKDIEVRKGGSCVFFMKTNHLVFGDYEFSLEIEGLGGSEAEFTLLRDALIVEMGGHPSRHLPQLQTPGAPILVSEVWRRQELAPSCYAGISLHDGAPVQLKVLRCTEETRATHQRIAKRAAQLQGRGGVLPYLRSWCEHGQSPPCRFLAPYSGPADDEDIYYVVPLYEYNFETMPWARLTTVARLRYCYQTLVGLANIHNRGCIHGGIRACSLWLLPDSSARVGRDLDGRRKRLRFANEGGNRQVDHSRPWSRQTRQAAQQTGRCA